MSQRNGQREKLKDLVIAFCNERGSRSFELKPFNAKYGDFKNIGIGGKTPRNTVQRLLQELRDAKFIQFLEKSGHYTLRDDNLLDYEQAAFPNTDLSGESPERREYLVEVFNRNSKLVKDAKKKYGRECLLEGCGNTFVDAHGEPYIEVHHVVPLCQGGEDRLENLSVLCAHHHRKVHFAQQQEKTRLTNYLLDIVKERNQG